jgi:hypothetical protein
LEDLPCSPRAAHALSVFAWAGLPDACCGYGFGQLWLRVRQRKWGWWLAVAIFAVNGLSDAGQMALGQYIEGGIGVIVAGAILLYLYRPKTKAAFG